jgi:hypothetical protein
MLHTIEVLVEPGGTIRLLEPLHVVVPTRAILTLLPSSVTDSKIDIEQGNGAAIFALLQTPRFLHRPMADPEEVTRRIGELRSDWNDEP